MIKTLVIAASSLAMIAAPIAASAQPYGHGDNSWRSQRVDTRNNGRDFGGRDGRGDAAIAAGLFGLFLTAAIVSNHPYAEPAAYTQRCDWETQAFQGPYGQVHYQQVQVCR
jgi:hypothetical protein